MPRGVIPDPTLLPNGPDLDGWRDAMNRLRLALGQDVTFHLPVANVWDPAVAIDPESGEPYDPTEVPLSGGGTTDLVIHCTVVSRPIRRGHPSDVVADEPVGVQWTGEIALLVGEADGLSISTATGFTLNDEDYRITEILADGLTRVDRYIVFGDHL